MSQQIEEFPGTSLSEKDFKEGRVLFRPDAMNGQYS